DVAPRYTSLSSPNRGPRSSGAPCVPQHGPRGERWERNTGGWWVGRGQGSSLFYLVSVSRAGSQLSPPLTGTLSAFNHSAAPAGQIVGHPGLPD
ncbi:hypothetical protein ABG768_012696, partial [Culter alburnus]